jgi:hypothetical protein
MDRNQFVQLAVAAIIGAVVKEVVSWLISFSKFSVLTPARKEKVGKLFSKANRQILFHLLWFAVSLLILIHTMRETTPLTRGAILWLFLQIVNVVFWGFAIMVDFIELRISRPDFLPPDHTPK